MVNTEHGYPDHPENKPPAPPALRIDADMDEADARRERQQEQEIAAARLRDKRDQRMVWFTGAIAVATIVYAIISYAQWRALHDQLTEARAEASANAEYSRVQLRKLNNSVYEQGVSAKAAGKAAAATKTAAQIAATALKNDEAQFSTQMAANNAQLSAMRQGVGQENRFAGASEKSSKISALSLSDHEAEQRANIGLNASVDYAANIITIGVYAKNLGPTAARQIKIGFYFIGYPTGASPTQIKLRQEDAYDAAAAALKTRLPNAAQSIAYLGPSADYAIKGAISNIQATRWDLMRHVPGGWVVAARATYEDIYGHSHWTDFCTFQAGGDTATYCARYNDQGDFPKPHRSSASLQKAR